MVATPNFLRRAESADTGKDYVEDEVDKRREPDFGRPRQIGPDEFGLRRAAPVPDSTVDIVVDLKRLADTIQRDPLREIAVRTQALTYGEMMEYVAAVMGPDYKAPQTAYEFAGMMDAWCKHTLSAREPT